MIQSPLVSIIVPCYNYGAFLSDALESVLSQTYINWQCIIIDDGSVDNTKDVSLSFTQRDSRFIYIYQQNKGISAARNKGLKISNGKYIQPLDADDMLESDKLKLQVEFLERNPNVDLIYSDVKIFDNLDTEKKLNRFIFNAKQVSGKGEVLLNELVVDNFFLPGCAIFKRDLILKVGAFKEELNAFEDWHFWIKSALLGYEFYFDNRLGTHLLSRNHGNNVSGRRESMWVAKVLARHDIIQFSKELKQADKLVLSLKNYNRLLKKNYALLNRDKARYNLFFGNVIEGAFAVLLHAYYSGKPYFAFYDGAYWIKERLKVL